MLGIQLNSKLLLGLIAFLAVASCNAPPREKTASPDETRSLDWELVFEEDFSDDSYQEQWQLDGFADLEIAAEGSTSYLKIKTKPSETNPDNKQSVLWCRKRFPGDLRFVFRAKGDPGNRSIFYFNANPTPISGYNSIFDWDHPDAQMTQYAGKDIIELYTVGILRDDQAECNLRYIGGTTAPAYREYLKNPGASAQAVYGRETIFQAYYSPFLNKPYTWFEFDLQILGRRLAMKVDGETVFGCEDPGNVGTEDYPWTSLTNGGWLGFRNFVPGTVYIDYLKVYRKK